MPTAMELASIMKGKDDQDLLRMFNAASQWSEEALEAAGSELQKRGVELPQMTSTPDAEPQVVKRPGIKMAGIMLLLWCMVQVMIEATTSDQQVGSYSASPLVVDFLLAIWLLASNPTKVESARKWVVFRCSAGIIVGPILTVALTRTASVFHLGIDMFGYIAVCGAVTALLWDNRDPLPVLPWRVKTALPLYSVGIACSILLILTK